jgi:glycosyltransferase involved in cell wall biosynthesis
MGQRKSGTASVREHNCSLDGETLPLINRAGPMIWYIFPAVGGPGLGRYWRGYHLARAWQNAGADPIVIGPGYHHYFLERKALAGTHLINGVAHYFIPTRPYGNLALNRLRAILTFGIGLLTDAGLAEMAANRSPDIIVYSSPYPFGYLAAHRLARRHRAALVFEVRDLWPLSLTDILGLAPWHPFVLAAGACERMAYATADRVVSLLPDAGAHMAKRGLDPRNFVYIPNGVDVEQERPAACYSETPLLRRAQTLASAGKFLLVHSGNMSITTHLHPLIEAARLLQDQGRADIAVLLIGRGQLESSLKAQARDNRLANVEFFPQVDKCEIHALLRIADAGFAALTPSAIYRFGLSPNKLFDYMLAARPIVFASDVPGNVVARTGAGITVPASNPAAISAAIVHLADLPAAERARMGAQGRAYVEAEHDYQMLGQRYLNVFEELRPDMFHARPSARAGTTDPARL